MRLFSIMSVVVALALAAAFVVGRTGEPATPPRAVAGLAGDLDGMVFEGTFGPADGSRAAPDTLHFADGHFWSGICVACAFLPGEYWTRTRDGVTEFAGVMGSPERGTFTYLGRVEDGVVRAEVHWERARWYWTLEKDYVFEGRLAPAGGLLPETEAGGAAVTLDQAWMRALGERDPSCRI